MRLIALCSIKKLWERRVWMTTNSAILTPGALVDAG
jgi:hypothetical protein